MQGVVESRKNIVVVDFDEIEETRDALWPILDRLPHLVGETLLLVEAEKGGVTDARGFEVGDATLSSVNRVDYDVVQGTASCGDGYVVSREEEEEDGF